MAQSRDPNLLVAVAVAMAKIGAPSAIDSLLSAALMDDGKDDVRKRAALGVLEKIYTRNAVPPVASLLANQQSTTSASTLAGAAAARAIALEEQREADRRRTAHGGQVWRR